MKMPVIGKNITRSEAQKLYPCLRLDTVVHPVEVQNKMPSEETLIPTWLIHPSRLLEPEFNKQVIESSRRDGIRVPIRVRPCSCAFLSIPHYEIVDGNSRHAGIITNKKMRCIVVELTNEQALHEMWILEKHGQKTAFWKSQLIAKLVEMKEKELKEKGIDKGAQKEVAKIINKDNVASGQVIVSQYLKIHRLFNYLKTLRSDLMVVKCLNKEKLLSLANFPRRLLPEALQILKKNPNKPIIEIRRELIGYRGRDRSKPKPRRGDRPFVPPKPDVMNLNISPKLAGRIRRIWFWIYELLEKELKETKGLHWTKREKILVKFMEQDKPTMLDIAQECLLMGIENVEHVEKEGSITISFDCVNAVPIGYKGIFKKRPK